MSLEKEGRASLWPSRLPPSEPARSQGASFPVLGPSPSGAPPPSHVCLAVMGMLTAHRAVEAWGLTVPQSPRASAVPIVSLTGALHPPSLQQLLGQELPQATSIPGHAS